MLTPISKRIAILVSLGFLLISSQYLIGAYESDDAELHVWNKSDYDVVVDQVKIYYYSGGSKKEDTKSTDEFAPLKAKDATNARFAHWGGYEFTKTSTARFSFFKKNTLVQVKSVILPITKPSLTVNTNTTPPVPITLTSESNINSSLGRIHTKRWNVTID